MMRPLFPLGRIVATRGVSVHLEQHNVDVVPFFKRHVSGDWGDLSPEDARANLSAIEHGARIMSSYDIASKRVWIITEADRSISTMLFPEEY